MKDRSNESGILGLARRLLGRKTDSTPGNGKGFQDIHVATCALLLEVAGIDGELTDSERKHIVSVLKENYELSDDSIAAVMKVSSKELEESIDLWRFTNLINRRYSIEEKIQMIETVWKIAYTDGTLEKHEDYLVHKLAQLLHLSHRDLIEAKMRVVNGE